MKNESSLQPGDLAIVIESVFGKTVGTVVQCGKTVGEHSLYGTMWEVTTTKEIVTEYGAVGKRFHSPQKWLKKIRPGELDKERELAKLRQSPKIKEMLEKL